MGNPTITKFWSSIINDDDFQEQLQSVLTIADKEERALQMMARTLFLFIMEIKAERDEVLKKMKEFSSVCEFCQKVSPKTTHDKPGPEKMNMDIVSCSNNKNSPQALPNSPDVIDASPITSSRGPRVASEGNDGVSESKTKANRLYSCLSRSPLKRCSSYIKSVQKGLSRSPLKSNYKCLSRSPLRRCSSYTKKGMSDDETETTATTSKPLMQVILVPETQLVTENRLSINFRERKALANQSVYRIPETLDIESSRTIDDEATGSRDFWDDSEKVGGLCDVVDGLRTPTKSKTQCKSAESPVLGKQSRSGQRNVPLTTLDILTEPQEKMEENVKESKATLTPETTTTMKPKHTTPTTPSPRPEHTTTTLRPEQTSSTTTTTLRPEHTTPTTKTAFRPEHITSPTPRYSPLVFAHGLSTSLNDSTETSPSLLQTVNKMSTRSCSEVPVNRKAEQLAEGNSEARKKFIEPVVVKSFHRSGDSTNSQEFVARKKTCLQKSMSSLNTSSKGRILRKHQTSDNHRQEGGGGGGGGVYKLTVTSPVAQRKRTYKQTKISEVLFQKTRQTGVGDGQAQGKIEEDEETAFLAAVKESMKTKVLDDLHRRQQQQEKRKIEEYKEESPIKIPRLSVHKPSPHKYSLRSTPDSPVKSSPSKGKIQEALFTSKTVQSMRQKVEQNKDAVTEKDITKQQEPKTKQGDGVLQLDEPVEQVTRNPNVKPCEASKLKSPQRKLSSKLSSTKSTRKLIHDSFDLLPEKDAGPDFVHQGDVVRGKAARQQLEGWECRECEQWYTDANLDPKEKKMLMNKCSRHRSKHNPVTNTPEGFWNPDWVDD